MRAIEIPDELAARVEATGLRLDRFVIDALEEKLSVDLNPPGRTLQDLIDAGWVLPTVEGSSRPDGRPWSEVEAACE